MARQDTITNWVRDNPNEARPKSRTDQIALLRKIKAGGADAQDCRETLILSNVRLVLKLAWYYAGHYNDNRHDITELLDEFTQEGFLGLGKAVDKYRLGSGMAFSTVATWWVRQAMTRWIAENFRTIRIPAGRHDQLNRMKRLRETLYQEFGRDPTDTELCDRLGEFNPNARVSMSDVLYHTQTGVSLDKPAHEHGNQVLGDILPDNTEARTSDFAEQAALEQAINKALNTLSKKESDCIRMRYGIGGVQAVTLTAIGEHFGFSKERARQIVVQAEGKLRHPSRARALSAFRL